MPVNFNVRVEGLKQLERNLSELGRTYGDPKYALQAIRPAIRAALLPIRDRIKQNTPVDTGGLKASTNLRITKATNKLKRNRNVGQDAVIVGQVGWFWRSPNSLWRQALSVEFGNATTKAQSTLRPALERNFSRIVATFRDTLGPAIEKKARQLAKKTRRR